MPAIDGDVLHGRSNGNGGTTAAPEIAGIADKAISEQAMARLAQTFPDRQSPARFWSCRVELMRSAVSLARHHQIQAKIQLEIMDIKEEISKLKLELRRDQDPSKMGRIQDQIAVSRPLPGSKQPDPR